MAQFNRRQHRHIDNGREHRLGCKFLSSTIQLVVLSRVQLIVEELGEHKVELTNPIIGSTISPAGVVNDDHSPQLTGTGLMDDVRRSGM